MLTRSASGDDGGASAQSGLPKTAHSRLHRVGPVDAGRRGEVPHAAGGSDVSRSGVRGFEATGEGARDRADAKLCVFGRTYREGGDRDVG